MKTRSPNITPAMREKAENALRRVSFHDAARYCGLSLNTMYKIAEGMDIKI
jgi:hypothetical protein